MKKCPVCNGTGDAAIGDYYWPWDCPKCGGKGINIDIIDAKGQSSESARTDKSKKEER